MRILNVNKKILDIPIVYKEIFEEFGCAICRSILDDPASLPCLHEFCAECLVTHCLDGQDNIKNEVDCPICREQSPVFGHLYHRPAMVVKLNQFKNELGENLEC